MTFSFKMDASSPIIIIPSSHWMLMFLTFTFWRKHWIAYNLLYQSHFIIRPISEYQIHAFTSTDCSFIQEMCYCMIKIITIGCDTRAVLLLGSSNFASPAKYLNNDKLPFLGSPYGICGRQFGIWIGFCKIISYFPCQLSFHHHSIVIQHLELVH